MNKDQQFSHFDTPAINIFLNGALRFHLSYQYE